MAVVRLQPADLREALRTDGTSLQFQVQVHAATSELAGVEAFVRWPHPVLGMVGPQEIAQLVAQGSLYVEFDGWVIRTAARQAAEWVRAGVALPLIAVNVWEETLRSPELPGILRGTERVELELPRGVAHDPSLAATLARLRQSGVRLASDALAIEMDTLKLRAPFDGAVVATAKGRGLRVVAEGVETAEQQAQALAAGCEIVQGYVFGPEVSASEVATLARR